MPDYAPRWLWNSYQLDREDIVDYWHVSGLLWRGRVLLGLLVKPDYPQTDPLWPGAGGEIGIVVLGRLWGWWHDPGS